MLDSLHKALGEQLKDLYSAEKQLLKALPKMAKGDKPALVKLTAEGHETKPPARYTEASLVKAMVDERIGRLDEAAGYMTRAHEEGEPMLVTSLTVSGVDSLPAWLQRIVELDQHGSQTIGRSNEADVTVDWDTQVSSVHVELRRLAGDWLVIDDGMSANGTFVNNQRIERALLKVGDSCRLCCHLAFQPPCPI